MNFPEKLNDSLKRRIWWMELEPQWKMAFQETVLDHRNMPNETELETLCSMITVRFAGPTALYPNMTFELTNLSGLKDLTNLETVVVIHHQLKGFSELLGFINIKNLFLTDNQIDNLEGIETLTGLEQLYCNSNFIISIKPVQSLKTLKTFYINNNQLTSLDGLTKHHANTLKTFFCLPNDNLPYKEIIRVEHKLGIKCSKG